MNILAVDDEYSALESLERAIRMAEPDAKLACFDTWGQALAYARETRIDTAFLDIEMPEMDGLALAKRLIGIHRNTNIIFVTGFKKYAADALDIRVSGYVMKPIQPKRVREELDNLRHPIDYISLTIGSYTLDDTSKRVYCNGADVLLHPREYMIFRLLASHPGVYYTPQELYEKTAGLDANEDVRALYSHISRLRKKLGLDESGAPGSIEIEQSRGKGYRLIAHQHQ